MEIPRVSIIVPTRNASRWLDECLVSVRAQSYPNIELIVVDNGSTDGTREIARRFTSLVYSHGPERSAQVDFGVARASGRYVYKVDADFVLEPNVVEQCVRKVDEGFDAVVVHNSPDPSVSWIARIRRFEVDMYKYDLTHSSARFVRKSVYEAVGGFDERITAGEDYDFQNRLNRAGYRTGFVDAVALHRGEPVSLLRHMMKYYRYGKNFRAYRRENVDEAGRQLAFFRAAYARNWRDFVRHPVIATAFLTYSVLKFAFGGWGYVRGAGDEHDVT